MQGVERSLRTGAADARHAERAGGLLHRKEAAARVAQRGALRREGGLRRQRSDESCAGVEAWYTNVSKTGQFCAERALGGTSTGGRWDLAGVAARGREG